MTNDDQRTTGVVGTGVYFPANIVTADDIDRLAGLAKGTTLRTTGVLERRFVGRETSSVMAAAALDQACGNIRPDLLISAGGTPQQIIPSTASLIAAEMGWRRVAAFDINASCMGFLSALEVASSLLENGRYGTIAIACADISSGGINWKDPESAGILGDGAGAVLLRGGAGFFRSRMEAWPEGVGLTRVRGGGTELPASRMDSGNKDEFLFRMDGPRVFRLAARALDEIVSGLIGESSERWNSFAAVIPHQASPLAIRHMSRRLKVPESKVVSVVERLGNTIAAGMPIALHTALNEGRAKSGDKVVLVGTGAGLLAGAAVLKL